MNEKNRFRKKQVIVRLTDEEYLLLNHKSELANMNMSEFFRSAIIDTNIIVKKLPVDEIISMQEIIHNNSYEINKIGNNINQLVKLIHENNDTYSKSQIDRIMGDMENVIMQYDNLCDVMINKLYGLE